MRKKIANGRPRKNKDGTKQWFEFVPNSYLERTSRPVYAIVFLLPFIIFYELGTIFINTDVLNQSQVRVVAFVWLQNLLEYAGFGSRFAWMAPPLAVVVILAALQLTSRKRWRFWLGDVWPMIFECVALSVPLIVLTLFLSSSPRMQARVTHLDRNPAQVQPHTPTYRAPMPTDSPARAEVASNGQRKESLLADIVTGIGAGIYEELLFRLILIGVLLIFFQDVLQLSNKVSIILSVLISAALFSAHHHIIFLDGQFGQTAPFNWPEFTFRAIAGIYFAALFAIRGFAITAGTHAFYDIIAVLINVAFFRN